MLEKENIPVFKIENKVGIDEIKEIHEYLDEAEKLGQQTEALLALLEQWESHYKMNEPGSFDGEITPNLSEEELTQPYHQLDAHYKWAIETRQKAFVNAVCLAKFASKISTYKKNEKENPNILSGEESGNKKIENFHFNMNDQILNNDGNDYMKQIMQRVTNVHELFGLSSIPTSVCISSSYFLQATYGYEDKDKNGEPMKPGESWITLGEAYFSGKLSKYGPSFIDHETFHQIDDYLFKIEDNENFEAIFKKHKNEGYMNFLSERLVFKNAAGGHPMDDEREFFCSFLHSLQNPNILEILLPEGNIEEGMLLLVEDTAVVLLKILKKIKKEHKIENMPIEKQLQAVLNYTNNIPHSYNFFESNELKK